MNALLRILRQIFGEIFPDPMSETLAADIAAVVFMLPAVPDAPRIRLFASGGLSDDGNGPNSHLTEFWEYGNLGL